MAQVEWDFRAADTHLASACTDTDTTLELAHPLVTSPRNYPAMSIWATIAPDDPNAREDILINSMSGAIATVKRGVGYSTGTAHRMGTPVRLGTRAGAYPEDWREVVNFQNNWVAAGGSNPPVAYKRFPDGLVILRGTVTGGTVGTAAFTLPGGYRPADGQLLFAAEGSSAYRRVDVQTSGAVVPQTASPTALDTIRYYAEA